MATNDEVSQYLKTVDFPASKEEIVRAAKRAGAPESVRKALQSMPAVAYYSKDEVLRWAGTSVAPKVKPVGG
jgi:uncharacterized protein DUF2795